MHNGMMCTADLVLLAAKEWGCTPWEIAGGTKIEWFERWKYSIIIDQKANAKK